MEKMAEVSRLSSSLAARVRYAQIVRGPILPAQIAALLDAAKLLQAQGEPWPPLVGRVLRDIARDLDQPDVEG